ncbi:unnamed protein product [Thlaspi arvense]|uniref:Uncharacterized protein n=1 Tax=Thlaspi arvense TaxID=13288 RepID=A0AAU9T9D1_THLAR|nr:unnamed protein product [Thlaspi arvense]
MVGYNHQQLNWCEGHTLRMNIFGDKRAEARVAAAEALARQRLEEANYLDSQNESAVTEPTPQQLIDAYIDVAMNNKGHVYGLGSTQHVDVAANESAGASLRRNMDVEMRMTDMEGHVGELSNECADMKKAMAVLLLINGVDPVTLQQVPRACSSESADDPTQLPPPKLFTFRVKVFSFKVS